MALLRGDHDATRRLLTEALALWRGDAYAGIRSESVVRAARVRLDELRSSVTEDLIDSRLASGEHAALVPELEAIVAKHPERERLWGLLMVALDRCGRQADALRAFQRARTHLVDEVGIEPGPDLRAIERSILNREATETAQPATPSAVYVENDDA